jgi:hypothetical protein
MEDQFDERILQALALILTQQEDQGKVLEALVEAVVALRAAPAEPAKPKSSKWLDYLKVGLGTGAALADPFVKNPDNRDTMGKATKAAGTAIDIMDRFGLGKKREKES